MQPVQLRRGREQPDLLQAINAAFHEFQWQINSTNKPTKYQQPAMKVSNKRHAMPSGLAGSTLTGEFDTSPLGTSGIPESASRKMLLQLLESGNDMELAFAAADGSSDIVPAHSLYLKQWSKVLAVAIHQALQIDSAVSSDCSSDTSSSLRISMPGTSKEDWLLAMEHVYPIVPRPTVSWATLEVLLRIGKKYDMPALLERASTFWQFNKRNLNLDPSSDVYAWKWIMAIDQHGMTEAAKQCITAQAKADLLRFVDAMPRDDLHKLSGDTLQPLILVISESLARPNYGYCKTCRAVRNLVPGDPYGRGGRPPKCSKCGASFDCT